MTKSPTVTFRPATPRDADTLAALARETFTDTFGHLYSEGDLSAHLAEKCSPQFFRDALDAGDDITLVEDGGQPVGYSKVGGLGLPVAYPIENAQEIHRIYVRRSHHHQGLGQQLLDRAFASERLKRASVVYLGVWEENDRAKQFYYRNGFMPVGRYLYPVGQQLDRELILAQLMPAHEVCAA
ncbi:MAG: GNAT family N-acetyltransferase [Alphaproteobacteria bacterium]